LIEDADGGYLTRAALETPEDNVSGLCPAILGGAKGEARGCQDNTAIKVKV
jgi:hypothetical protein